MGSSFLTLLVATLMGMSTADEASTYALDNGLIVRLVPLQGEKRVSLILGVQAGFFREPTGFPHLAHVTEHLVVFGLPADSEEKQAAERWFHEGRANGETLSGWMYFDLQVDPGNWIRLCGSRRSDCLIPSSPKSCLLVKFLERSPS